MLFYFGFETTQIGIDIRNHIVIMIELILPKCPEKKLQTRGPPKYRDIGHHRPTAPLPWTGLGNDYSHVLFKNCSGACAKRRGGGTRYRRIRCGSTEVDVGRRSWRGKRQ